MEQDKSNRIKFKNGSVINFMDASRNRTRGKGFMYLPDEEESKINFIAVAFILSAISISFLAGIAIGIWLG